MRRILDIICLIHCPLVILPWYIMLLFTLVGGQLEMGYSLVQHYLSS